MNAPASTGPPGPATVTLNQPVGRTHHRAERDDEDTAVVLTILAALAASTDSTNADQANPAAPTVWGDPAHRLGVTRPAATGWWASGLPR